MITQKEIKSKINVIKARLDQIEKSPLYNKEEKVVLIKKLTTQLNELTSQIDVVF